MNRLKAVIAAMRLEGQHMKIGFHSVVIAGGCQDSLDANTRFALTHCET